jgi:hypothetical protein
MPFYFLSETPGETDCLFLLDPLDCGRRVSFLAAPTKINPLAKARPLVMLETAVWG